MEIAENLLAGVVGSMAYNLNGPESDVDRLGVFAAPTTAFHGLNPPTGSRASLVTHEPDVTLHEAGKFATLALNGNPSVMELMWLEEYELITDLGQDLIDIRKSFLCAPRVRDAYLGFADQQLKRMGQFTNDRPREEKIAKPYRPEKVAKHARHLLRLLIQGVELYQTGELRVRLTDHEVAVVQTESVLASAGDMRGIWDRFDKAHTIFDAGSDVLPDKPDHQTVEDWLLKVRMIHYIPYSR
jgi:predicted nucleotidyltransferase